jgi:hypothetical protein
MKEATSIQFEITEEIELALNSIVCFSGKFEYHPEFDGRYAISTDKKPTRFIVNSEAYKILSYTAKKNKVSLINISGTKKVFYSKKFQQAIKMLIEKKYLNKIA